jgi:hypothetical protein
VWTFRVLRSIATHVAIVHNDTSISSMTSKKVVPPVDAVLLDNCCYFLILRVLDSFNVTIRVVHDKHKLILDNSNIL